MREETSAVRLGERKREMQLHPGREKGNEVTSGKGKGKCSYIRGEKREMQLYLERETGNLSESMLR